MKVKLREKYMSFKFKLKGYRLDPYLISQKIEKSQYWDRDQLENYQLARINDMFKDAKQSVNYYGNGKYSHLKRFKSLEDFKENAPILTKDEIKIRGGLRDNVLIFSKPLQFNELENLIRQKVKLFAGKN